MKTIYKSLVIALLALGLGLVTNSLRPHPLPWSERWSLRIEAQAAKEGLDTVNVTQVQQILDAKDHLIFDARPAAEFAAGRIAGAMSVPMHDASRSLEVVQALLTPDQSILVYCSGQRCEDSLSLARLLRSQGFTRVKIFVGGFEAWMRAGLAIERDS